MEELSSDSSTDSEEEEPLERRLQIKLEQSPDYWLIYKLVKFLKVWDCHPQFFFLLFLMDLKPQNAMCMDWRWRGGGEELRIDGMTKSNVPIT